MLEIAGVWGEVQLGVLLDDMFTKYQIATNMKIRPDSGEIVEYAVRLPRRSGDDVPCGFRLTPSFPRTTANVCSPPTSSVRKADGR